MFTPGPRDAPSPVAVPLLVVFTIVAMLAACGDDGPASPGSGGTGQVSVHTATSGGWMPDGGGLQVWVVGDPTTVREIGLNGSTTFELPMGEHELEIFRGEGQIFYSGCSVEGGTTRSVSVRTAETVLEDFELYCEVVLELTSSTTGASSDPDGYRVLVGPPVVADEDLGYPVRLVTDDARLVLDRSSSPWWNAVPWGSDGPHSEDYPTMVYVWDIAPNCTLHGPNPLVLDVGGGVTSRELQVECVESPPATGTIYYLDGGLSQIVRVGANGTSKSQVTDGPAVRRWSLSPDGTRIVFSPWYDGGLFTVGIDGTGQTRITPDDALPDEDPEWGADGRILFTRYDSIRIVTNLFSIRPDGTDSRQLTTDGAGSWASVSPDGARILFFTGAGLETMDPDGSNRTVLAPGVFLHDPRWSPDGTRIAGHLRTVPYWEGAVYELNSGELTVVARRPLQSVTDLAWAPDGQNLVYHARTETQAWPVDYDEPGGLYRVSIDGRNRGLLVEGVSWVPVGLGMDWRD